MGKSLINTWFFLMGVLAGPSALFAQVSPNCCTAPMVYGTPGTAGSAAGQFNNPQRAVVVGSGPASLYVADTDNARIDVLDQATGAPLTVLTDTGANPFVYPRSLALDGSGHLFMVDSGANRVYVVDLSNNSILGNSFNGGSGAAAFYDPEGVCVNSSGSTVVVDENANQRIRVFTSSNGTSTGTYTPIQDLTVPAGLFPVGMAMDSSGNLFVCITIINSSPHEIVEYPYSPDTGYSSTPVTLVYNPPGRLNDPVDLSLDPAGNIYVADTGGDYEVYYPSGQFTGVSCNSAAGMNLSSPHGIYYDPADGNLYVSDTSNHRVVMFSPCAIPTPTPSSGGSNPPAPGRCFVYPSPARGDHATLSYDMAESGWMDLKIFNENGELAADITDRKTAGVQVTPFSLSRLAPGVYYYVVTLDYDSGRSERLKPDKFAVVR